MNRCRRGGPCGAGCRASPSNPWLAARSQPSEPSKGNNAHQRTEPGAREGDLAKRFADLARRSGRATPDHTGAGRRACAGLASAKRLSGYLAGHRRPRDRASGGLEPAASRIGAGKAAPQSFRLDAAQCVSATAAEASGWRMNEADAEARPGKGEGPPSIRGPVNALAGIAPIRWQRAPQLSR